AGDVIGGQRRRAKLGEFDIVEPRYGNIARDLEALFPQLAHHADGHEIVDAENRRGPKARFKQFARSLPAPLQAIRPREDPGIGARGATRSEERRVGKEWRSRGRT